MNDNSKGEREVPNNNRAGTDTRAGADTSNLDFSRQESSFALLRTMPQAHLRAFYELMREGASSAAEVD